MIVVNHTGIKNPNLFGRYAGFGIKPPNDVRIWWGARAIYSKETIKLTWDRQQMVGDTETERRYFARWINNFAIPEATKIAKLMKLNVNDRDRVIKIQDKNIGYCFVGNTNCQYGYLFLGAWSTGD